MPERDQDETASRSGLAGTLKLIAVVAVLLLALLAAGFVLDLVPREVIGDLVTKVVVLAGIGAASAFLIGVLIGRGRREQPALFRARRVPVTRCSRHLRGGRQSGHFKMAGSTEGFSMSATDTKPGSPRVKATAASPMRTAVLRRTPAVSQDSRKASHPRFSSSRVPRL